MFVLQSLPLPTVNPAGLEHSFCDAFKRGNKPKGRWGETMSAWPLGLLLLRKRPRGSGRSRVSLLVVTCFILVYLPVFFIFSFLWGLKNNIEHDCVLRVKIFIVQDTRDDLWCVLLRCDPNDHLVNIWCCLTGMSGLHNSAWMLSVTFSRSNSRIFD